MRNGIQLPSTWFPSLKRQGTPSIKISGCSFVKRVDIGICLQLEALCGPLEATITMTPTTAIEVLEQLQRAIDEATKKEAA